MSPMDHNPYAPPTADQGEIKPPPELEGGMTLAEAEALRRRHLTHEARLQSIGSVMLLGALNVLFGPLLALTGVLSVVGYVIAPGTDEGALFGGGLIFALGVLFTGVGALSVRGGLGLRRLDPKHRTLYTVLVSLWLLSCSFLSLLGIWALYLIHSKAGETVLSAEHREARRLTPHIKFKTSVVTWIAFALLVLGPALVLFLAAL